MNVGSSKYPIDIDDILARAKRLGLLGKETRLKMLEKRSQLEEFVVNPCVDTMVDLGKSIQTKALIWHAISSGRCEPVLKYAGKSQLDSDMCFVACQANGENLAYVPDRLLNEDIVKVAISNRGDMLSVVPQQYRTYDICYTAVLHDYSEDALATQNIPENLFVGESGRVLYTAAITHNPLASNYLPCILKLNSTQLVRPCLKSKTLVVSNAYSTMVHKVFDPQDISALSIYYVSDIHLEHQLSLNGALEYDARLLIRKKIRELTQCISEKRAIILFAGDITCYPHLHRIYREEMGKAHRSLDMDWFFVYILGNHELWNGNPVEVGPHRDIETVIRSYRRDLWDVKDKVLENSALIKYTPWNQFPLQYNFREISEQQLLSMPMDELSGLCQQSAMIILGGVGFAGLNTEFNATNGIYRSTITREEEIVRSHRFVAIYKKFLACAADKQVIVLTHMPMSDWTDMEPNPN